MKSTGIVRKIDDLGRIVIPKEIRKTHGINEGDPLEICIDGNRIVLQKYQEEDATLATVFSALRLAAKDAGKKPVEYINAAKQEAKDRWKD